MSHRFLALGRFLVPLTLAVALAPLARAEPSQPTPQARLVAPPDVLETTRRLQDAVTTLSELGKVISAEGGFIRCGCLIGPPPPPVKASVRVSRESLEALHRAIQALTVIEENARR